MPRIAAPLIGNAPPPPPADPFFIELENYNITQFENLISDHLANNSINQLTFNRGFTLREKQIIANKYIASYYNGLEHTKGQLYDLALQYNIDLNVKFNYLINNNRHDVELHGLTINDFSTGYARQVINNLRTNKFPLLYNAILANDLPTIKHLVALNINLQTLINGRLPLELACELGHLQVVNYFIFSCKIDAGLSNINGLNALQQACLYRQTEVLKLLVTSRKCKVSYFLDNKNPNYSANHDVVKLIIDSNNPALLNDFLQALGILQQKESYIDDEYLLRMFNYATESKKLRIVEFLNLWNNNVNREKTKLINAILAHDLDFLNVTIQDNKYINKCINGKYPAEVASELGYIDILSLLFNCREPELVWYDYKDKDCEGYNSRLDLTRYAIKRDDRVLLDFLLRQSDGQTAYMFNNQEKLARIKSKALRTNKQQILNYIRELEGASAAHIKEMFLAAVSGDVDMLFAKLALGININTFFEGKTIAHLLCENGYFQAFQAIINNPQYNIDLNILDIEGNYPLTIACLGAWSNIVCCILQHETARKYSFDERTMEGYTPKLDPVLLAIKHNKIGLLEDILRVMSNNSPEIISVEILLRMLTFAYKCNNVDLALQLEQYINLVRNGRPIFALHLNTDLQNTINHAQSISRVETSFIASIKQICKYFDIDIVPSINGAHKTLYGKYDFNAIFLRLEDMIYEAKDTNYRIYKQKKTGGTSSLTDEIESYAVTDSDYQEYAKMVFDLFLPLDSTHSVHNKWHTSWFDDYSEEIQLGTGLSAKHVWCLAILAAQDINALPGKVLTTDEIKDREQILVRCLVDCARAYNCNNNEMLDYGGDSRASCTHGIAIRSFLCLSHLHKKIVILSNPIEWAAEIAESILLDFFKQYPNNEYIAECYSAQNFQLDLAQKEALKQFYKQAEPVVHNRLVEELGMVKKGGYLLEDDLKKILANIEYIQLHIEREVKPKSIDKILNTQNFTVIEGGHICSEDGMRLEQVKLPFTPDSAYIAVILGAINAGLDNVKLQSANSLRTLVADIMRAVIFNTEQLPRLIERNFAYCGNKISTDILHKLILRKLENHFPGCSNHDYEQLIASISRCGHCNPITFLLMSAIYGCNFRIFDFHGEFLMEISTREIFVPVMYTNKYINIATKAKQIDGKRDIAFNVCNALVSSNTWRHMSRRPENLEIKSPRDIIKDQKLNYANNEVMSGCSIEGFDQVMIVSSGCGMFDATLLGAKHAGAMQAFVLSDAAELKRLVQKEMQTMIESLHSDTQQTSPELFDAIWNAIAIHNHDHYTSFSNINEYICSITDDRFWGGDLELSIISRLLSIQINVHAIDYDVPKVFSDNPACPHVHLYKNCEHFNLLVQAKSWAKLEKLNPTENVKRHKNSNLL